MMKKITNRLAAISPLMLLAAPASAATIIDFDELTSNRTFTFGNTLESKGFVFQNSLDRSNAFGVWSRNKRKNADKGGATLFNNFSGTTTTITSQSGAFDFNSIDLADVFNNGKGGNVRFDFTTSSGTTSQTVTVDNQRGLETFVFNVTDLNSVSYTPLTTKGPWVQVDNVVFNGSIAGAVPEPSTWALMLLGFFVVGTGLRRRSKQSNGAPANA